MEGREVLQAGERRLARVESLRALAALGVASAHAYGISHRTGDDAIVREFPGRLIWGGGYFVFLFFALSGYLLFWPFAQRHWGDGAAINLRRYAINRAVRILPLYYFAVIFLLIVQEHGGTPALWWRFLLLGENFSQTTVGRVDGVLWSVVVEIHFYVLLPLLVLVLARVAGRSRRRAAVFLGALGAASAGLYLWQVTFADHYDRLWAHNFPATFVFFVPGMWLALLRLDWEERPPAWLRGWVAHSSTWMVAAAAMWLVVFCVNGFGLACALAAFLLVGASVLPLREGVLRRALDWRPLAAVGVASYSLYVWHTRVMTHLFTWDPFPQRPIVFFVLVMAISVGVAFVSYRLVEAPFLALRRRWSKASPPIESEHRTALDPSPA